MPFTDDLLPRDRLEFFTTYWALVAIVQVLALYFFGLYDRSQPRQAVERARRLLPAIAIVGLGLGAFFFLADRTFPRSVLVIFTALDFLLLGAWRTAMAVRIRREPLRLALIGSGSVALELAETLLRDPTQEIELVGWVRRSAEDGTEPESAPELSGTLGPCLGAIDDLPDLIRAGRVDDLVIAEDDAHWRSHLLDTLALAPGDSKGNVLLLPGPFESTIGRMRYRWVQDLPLIEVVRDTEWRLLRPVKRTLDLLAGTVMLVVAAPLILACSVAVKLTSPGPVFYRQERVGRGLEPFTLWKLRTMRVDAEPESREVLATLEDPRLTPAGAILRRYRLDELPQLFNVLGGSMSLVGPRPERPGFVQRYLDEVPGYAERFSVAPGLTGLAQINGEYHSTARNKLRYDLAYIANWSLWLDLAILVRTVKIVLTSRGV
jgi:exopolysaccharide biosynthesis polyprenyl glycosylphosphotransferase